MNQLDLGGASMLLPVALYALAVALALGSPRGSRTGHILSCLVTAAAALAGAAIATSTLLGGSDPAPFTWAVTPYAALSFRVDALAAFFLLVVSVPAIAAAWYGIGYLDAGHDSSSPHAHHDEPPARTDAFLAAFLAAMTLVVLASNVFAFFFAWELMSLLSFFLVLGSGRRPDNVRSALIYLVMTHVGSACLLIALLLLGSQARGLDFTSLQGNAASLGDLPRAAALLLAGIGFATKAGLIPLHVWLPLAHPAAPSHVSALMSGVMVKTALYGLIRLIWEWAAPVPVWWGALLFVAGVLSAVLGILYALMERDIKRMLAYSTVEHVGLITTGLGAAALLSAGGHAAAAALALVAALVHVLNHAMFKGLLFLGAGAVQTGSGTRDLERLGGLIKRMPKTAALALVGAVAIAALPPLNGFVGEWLLLQSLLQLGTHGGTALAPTAAAIGAGAIALTGALALAALVRFYGVGFLGQPRSETARTAHEVPASMLGGMALLAVLCVLFGVVPGISLRLLQPVSTSLVGATAQPALGGLRPFAASLLPGAYAPIALIGLLAVVGALPWLVARLIGGPISTRTAPPWGCGITLEPRMQYSATGFAKPIRLIFQSVLRPEREVALDRPDSPYVVRAVRYRESLHPIYERHLYQRGLDLLLWFSHRFRLLQSGSLRAYLTYLFVTLVVVLILAR
ncbi:MAG: proton-conducting transporter membrane subunit [Thermomicrobiales bacterium]